MSKLPPICRHGTNGFETKLLYYYHLKQTMRYELRYKDSTLYGEEDLPKCEGITAFVPLWEIAQRVFLFTHKVDMNKTRSKLDGFVKQTARRKKRNKRPRKKSGR